MNAACIYNGLVLPSSVRRPTRAMHAHFSEFRPLIATTAYLHYGRAGASPANTVSVYTGLHQSCQRDGPTLP